jgi:hypothetical protein
MTDDLIKRLEELKTLCSEHDCDIAMSNNMDKALAEEMRAELERLRAAIARALNLAELDAEGAGTNFNDTMAEARTAL